MQKIILFTFLILFTAACNKNDNEMPIDREKLRDVLIDIHIAEAAMQEYALQAKDSIGRVYYDQIFSLHGITEKDFHKSLYLLKQDSEDLDALYKEVLAELERREKEN